MLFTKQIRTTQPRNGPKLNPNHWLAKNLLFVHTGFDALYYGNPIPESGGSVIPRSTGGNTGNGNQRFGGINLAPNGVNYTYYNIPTRNSNNLTLSCWAYRVTGINNNYYLSIGGQGGQHLGRTTTAATAARAETVAGVSATAAGAVMTNNSWNHTVATFESDTLRYSFLNAGSKTSNTTSTNAGTLSYVTVLARRATAGTAVCLSEVPQIALPMVIDRVLTDEEILRLYHEQLRNPWALFLSQSTFLPAGISTVTICRPSADITTTGWTANPGPAFYTMVDETSPSDTDFILSPDLSAATPITFTISPSAPAGTHTVGISGRRTDTVGQVRVHLLDVSNVVQGSSAWQAFSGTETTYYLPITTTGTAVRAQIEVST